MDNQWAAATAGAGGWGSGGMAAGMGGVAAVATSPLEVAEKRFAEQAAALHTKVMDLNVPMQACQTMWAKLMNDRANLLTQYGVPPDPSWQQQGMGMGMNMGMMKGMMKGLGKGMGKASVKKASSGTMAATSYKGVLHCAIQKKNPGAAIAKDDVIYTTMEDDEGGFIGSVVSPRFLQGTYSSETACPTKKEAETNAAMVAVQHEFAEYYKGPLPVAEGGQKRKMEGGVHPNPAFGTPGQHLMQPNIEKGEVIAFMQVILERSVKKEDVFYQSTQQSPGSWSATLTFPTYDPSVSFSGTGSSQKAAENACAVQALPWVKPIAEPLMAAYKQRVEDRRREKKKRDAEEAAAKAVAA